MNLKRRLENLEERNRKAEEEPHTLPPEVGVLLALLRRSQARQDGNPVPPFTDAQLGELYRQDVELTGPSMEKWRATPGWTDEESQQLLDEWEEGAYERLGKLDAGMSLAEVYETIEENEDEEDTLDD